MKSAALNKKRNTRPAGLIAAVLLAVWFVSTFMSNRVFAQIPSPPGVPNAPGVSSGPAGAPGACPSPYYYNCPSYGQCLSLSDCDNNYCSSGGCDKSHAYSEGTCATECTPPGSTMTVACQAFYGSNSGNRLTVDPDNNVSFSVVVNGQNGGDGSQAFVWGCELTALGGPNCPSGFAGSGDLSGLTVSFADPGEGKAADYKITVAAIAADGTSKSDYCTITVDNNSGQQVVGAGKWQCHDANLACYNDQTSCAQGCSGQCVECVLNGSCSQGQDCNADATVQTDDPSQFLNGLGGHKPPTYPVVPDNSKLLVNGVGGGGLNLGVLKPPNFSDFMGLLQAVFKYLLFFAIPLAVLVFAAASVVMLTSRGEPNKLSTAKKMFVWGAVGLAIILLAQGILSAVMSLLTGGH